MDHEALAGQIAAWQNGIAYELEFWGRWYATQGAEWPEGFKRRLNPDAPLTPGLEPSRPVEEWRILDVGAGPMSTIGAVYEGGRATITACDPLAPFYAEMAQRHGIDWPVTTAQAFAEDLTAYYDIDSFDVVHCRNALDHSFDPVCGIQQMFLVAKPFGRVVLHHAVNEAETEGYAGFHQWNFNSRDGRFAIWNKATSFDATEMFSPYAAITCEVRNAWVMVTFEKNGILPPFATDHRARIREILAAVMISAAKNA
jgi:SAM-dependent methyltransferase